MLSTLWHVSVENSMLVKLMIMWTNGWMATRMIGNTSGSRGLLSQNTSVHQNRISSTKPRFVAEIITRSGQIERGTLERVIVSDIWTLYGHMVSTRATSRGNHHSLVRACDCLCGTFCSRDFPESQRVGVALSIGNKNSDKRISLLV